MTSNDTATIRELNDALRHAMARHVYLSRGICALGQPFVGTAIEAVRRFDAFTPGNDPYGEHDFGAFDLDCERVFWKIDYYDHTLENGSDDPADEIKTRRVLTVLLSEEY